VTVELETPFLSLKVSEVGELRGRRGGEGEEKKNGRQGGVVSRARLSRVCPARLREERGRWQLS